MSPAPARRLVVLGAGGSFGGKLRELLAEEGLPALGAARRPGFDLVCDLEDPASLRASLRPGDVVVDCVGPFQARTPALLEAACEVGFDVVDLADSVGYARSACSMDQRARSAGVRLMTGQSSVSALAGRALRASGLARPTALVGLLVPASRHTAAVGSARSLLESLGRPVEALIEGQVRRLPGWRTTRALAPPGGVPVVGHLFETADLVHLPAEFPGLRDVLMLVTSNVPGLDALLSLVDRVPALGGLVSRVLPWVAPGTRLLGRSEGFLAYELRGDGSARARVAYRAGETSPRIPVLPALLAARMLVEGRGPGPGVFPPARELDDGALDALLARHQVRLERD